MPTANEPPHIKWFSDRRTGERQVTRACFRYGDLTAGQYENLVYRVALGEDEVAVRAEMLAPGVAIGVVSAPLRRA